MTFFEVEGHLTAESGVAGTTLMLNSYKYKNAYE